MVGLRSRCQSSLVDPGRGYHPGYRLSRNEAAGPCWAEDGRAGCSIVGFSWRGRWLWERHLWLGEKGRGCEERVGRRAGGECNQCQCRGLGFVGLGRGC